MRIFLIISFVFMVPAAKAQRGMENLDRGVAAQRLPNGSVMISWRLLGTEDTSLNFRLYKSVSNGSWKLIANRINDRTWFHDNSIDTTHALRYKVEALGQGTNRGNSVSLAPGNLPYYPIHLQTPAGYAPNDASVADLDGDGRYEIILHQTGSTKDNSQPGVTDPAIIQAYTLEGRLLWNINLGVNIRDGAHYTQMMVYDLDGDGRAEIALKTADGTRDGLGHVIGDSMADYRDDKGFIMAGPEYLTVFDGLTGAARFTTRFIPARFDSSLHPTPEQLKAVWGDGKGNRMDRFLAAIAYLGGIHPSLIECRGYYTRTVITAWDWNGRQLKQRWTFDSDDPKHPEQYKFRGQGNHNLSIADVDNDGKDEIIYGAMALDDNGQGLYSTGFGHGDALHVTDLDPSHPGLEVLDIQERFDDAGMSFRGAGKGEVLWKKASIKAGEDGEGPGRGLALDIDPRYPGYECWSRGAEINGLFNCKGEKIGDSTPACNMGVYWDGDELSEILNSTYIQKWDWRAGRSVTMLNAADYNCVHNNGTKSNPVLSADLWRDWREEVIWRTADNQELRIFTTTIPTQHKFYTLMHDPQYRLSIAWQNVAYNQPPHTGFYMGAGMKPPPKPNIYLIKPLKK